MTKPRTSRVGPIELTRDEREAVESGLCDPECEGRCRACPQDVVNMLLAALRSEGGETPPASAPQETLCPSCGKPLHKVRRPAGSMLNESQFDAVRVGDWYCASCPSHSRGTTAYRYFWDRELRAPSPVAGETPAAVEDRLAVAVRRECAAYLKHPESSGVEFAEHLLAVLDIVLPAPPSPPAPAAEEK